MPTWRGGLRQRGRRSAAREQPPTETLRLSPGPRAAESVLSPTVPSTTPCAKDGFVKGCSLAGVAVPSRFRAPHHGAGGPLGCGPAEEEGAEAAPAGVSLTPRASFSTRRTPLPPNRPPSAPHPQPAAPASLRPSRPQSACLPPCPPNLAESSGAGLSVTLTAL